MSAKVRVDRSICSLFCIQGWSSDRFAANPWILFDPKLGGVYRERRFLRLASNVGRGYAGVVELVDTLDLGSSGLRRGGSNPSARTTVGHIGQGPHRSAIKWNRMSAAYGKS